MNRRTANRVGWSVFGLQAALLPALIALAVLGPAPATGSTGSSGADAALGLGLLSFSFVGALIASRRPENTIGWLLLAAGLLFELSFLGSLYSNFGLAHPGSLPLPAMGEVLSAASWLPGTAMIGVFLFLLFPDGRLPSRRWKPLAAVALVAISVSFAGTLVFEPRLYDHPSVRNPIALVPSEVAFNVINGMGLLLILAGTLGAFASLVLRYRRAEVEQRHQIKWFVFTAVVVIPAFVLTSVSDTTGVLVIISAVALLALPVSIGIAIFKFRLYDIDVVINKTLVYGLLAAFITAVYVAIVVGIGALIGRGTSKPNLGLSILATAVVAVVFQPVRERVRKLANRLVYGKRATPYEVLSEFSARMAQSYASEDLLPRMARILAEGTGARTAVVWLKVGAELRPEAAWPIDNLGDAVPLSGDKLPEIEATLRLPVEHRGELLGALSLTKAPGERLTPAEEHLARDLASGAGLVLRNVRLTEELLQRLEELQASRQRIVAAQDSERRRLERNIHDGAQQQLVALAVKVRLARSLTERSPEKAEQMLAQVDAEIAQALEDLRDLARGIYPPLLADQGLAGALTAQARRAPLSVQVQAEDLGRYPPEQEAAVYFCSLEALQNIAKYARATRATVRLEEQDGHLTFEVTDDGAGFDTTHISYGTGLQGMADRLAAVGGTLDVRSQLGAGTTILGRLPVPALSHGREHPTGRSGTGEQGVSG